MLFRGIVRGLIRSTASTLLYNFVLLAYISAVEGAYKGAEYLVFSPLVPSKREKNILSLSQLILLSLYSGFTFQFLNDESAKWIFLT